MCACVRVCVPVCPYAVVRCDVYCVLRPIANANVAFQLSRPPKSAAALEGAGLASWTSLVGGKGEKKKKKQQGDVSSSESDEDDDAEEGEEEGEEERQLTMLVSICLENVKNAVSLNGTIDGVLPGGGVGGGGTGSRKNLRGGPTKQQLKTGEAKRKALSVCLSKTLPKLLRKFQADPERTRLVVQVRV